MAVGAVLLSMIMVALDERGPYEWLRSVDLIYLNQPEGARSVLSTIAGSMINVAGVVFSLTMVALTLASQQFGPRLMGNFMRDRGNQFVLGTFVATFLYCLLILRTIHVGEEGEAFVPHLSVSLALLIAVFTLGALIYFIHHIAATIQVQNVIAKVAGEINKMIAGDGIFPADVGTDLGTEATWPDGFEQEAVTVWSEVAGYIRHIDGDRLIRMACREDAILEIVHPPGTFIMVGDPLARLFPAESATASSDEVRRCFTLGAGRDPTQDIGALFDQLLELSQRSLSKASSDPLTASASLDRLGQAFVQLGRLEAPGRFRGDSEGNLRLITPVFRPEEEPRRVFTMLRAPLSRELLAAKRALHVLERVEAASSDAGVAAVARHERQELLDACREGMTEGEFRTLMREVTRQPDLASHGTT